MIVELTRLPLPEGQDFHLSLQFTKGRWKAVCAIFDESTSKRIGRAGVGYSDEKIEAITQAMRDMTA